MPRNSTGALKLITGTTALVTGASSVATVFYQGVIYCYDGAQPADADDAITTQTNVCIISLNGGAFVHGTGTNGLVFGTPTCSGTGAAKVVSLPKPALTLWAATCGTLSGTKTITWARLVGNATDAAGLSTTLPRIQMTASDATGTGELKLNTVTCVTGTEVSVAGFELKIGA